MKHTNNNKPTHKISYDYGIYYTGHSHTRMTIDMHKRWNSQTLDLEWQQQKK